MGLALRSKQPVFLHRCSKNDADKTSSAVWRKKDCCSRADVSCSQSHCCRKGSGGPQSYLLHFFIYMLHFFTQQSAPYAGLVWSSFRRVGTHFPAVRAVYGDVSGEKEGGCEKISFIFPFPARLFSFAVRKTFRRNAFLFHHNSMQRPALCRQNAQPCSHKGNTPGETGR